MTHTATRSSIRSLVLAGMALLAAACTGGGDGGKTPDDSAPGGHNGPNGFTIQLPDVQQRHPVKGRWYVESKELLEILAGDRLTTPQPWAKDGETIDIGDDRLMQLDDSDVSTQEKAMTGDYNKHSWANAWYFNQVHDSVCCAGWGGDATDSQNRTWYGYGGFGIIADSPDTAIAIFRQRVRGHEPNFLSDAVWLLRLSRTAPSR